jgi:hypothetical protein
MLRYIDVLQHMFQHGCVAVALRQMNSPLGLAHLSHPGEMTRESPLRPVRALRGFFIGKKGVRRGEER